MKTLILRLLRALSLVPARHLSDAEQRADEARQHLTRLQAKAEQLSQGLAAEREALASLRREHRSKAVDDKQADERRKSEQVRAVAAVTLERDAARVDAERWRARATELHGTIKGVKSKLAAAERTEGQLRDLLMATEVKLDLIEAAVNVLDQRTRHPGTP